MTSPRWENVAKLVLMVAIFGSFFLIPLSAKGSLGGVISGMGGPFGGKVLFSLDCSCTSFSFHGVGVKTTMITVGPPNGGTFIKIPLIGGYQKGNLSIGHWVIGMSGPGKVPCMVGKIPACVPAGYGNPIISVGTN